VRYAKIPIENPDEPTLATLASWAKKVAVQGSAFGGLGYSLTTLASSSWITSIYLLLAASRNLLGRNGETLETLATLGGVAHGVLFIKRPFRDVSDVVVPRVVSDYRSDSAPYTLDGGAFPFERDRWPVIKDLAVRVAKTIG
jgi:hypothetical protein